MKKHYDEKWCIVEEEYCPEDEAKNATLFTAGNGYMGVRGSFEELGSIGQQGCFIAGIFDTMPCPDLPVDDEIYHINFTKGGHKKLK